MGKEKLASDARSQLEKNVEDPHARNFLKKNNPLDWTGFLIAEPSHSRIYKKVHLIEHGRPDLSFDMEDVFEGGISSIALSRAGLFLSYMDGEDNFEQHDYVRLLTEGGMGHPNVTSGLIDRIIPWQDFETYAVRKNAGEELLVDDQVMFQKSGSAIQFPIYSTGEYVFTKGWEWIYREREGQNQLIADRGGFLGRNVEAIILKEGICYLFDQSKKAYFPINPEDPDKTLKNVEKINTSEIKDSTARVPIVEENRVTQYGDLMAGFANELTWQNIWQLPIKQMDALRRYVQNHQ